MKHWTSSERNTLIRNLAEYGKTTKAYSLTAGEIGRSINAVKLYTCRNSDALEDAVIAHKKRVSEDPDKSIIRLNWFTKLIHKLKRLITMKVN